ncbi:hypothetical protein BDB01DRAFT_842323 [Pilobolus umbonatus]|nr:hypothetical protein BDB01DRAFT_842323 [Pilobolus umbonatus]
MAQSSFKRRIIGTIARALHAIPVVRPQDLAVKGTGKLLVDEQSEFIVRGENTRFTQEVGPRDLISVNKSIKLLVLEVISDTELKLKSPMNSDEMHVISTGRNFKIIPHINQSVLYEKVHERFNKGGSILIFPEGGSHDRPEMLPLKAGFSIMALSAIAQNRNLNIKIVPVGLNYFHPHRFRSRAVVSYGTPISIKPELVEKYMKGGAEKHEAIAELLNTGYEGLKSVTINSPSYDVSMLITTARRLYKPAAQRKLRLDQVVELNRRFLIGYKYFEKDPRLTELTQRIQAYNNTLKYFHLTDHQVARPQKTGYSAATIFIARLFKLIFLSLFGFPSVLLNSPILFLSLAITQRKQEEALAGSTVKIAARDVLATWKILVAAVGAPLLYGIYSLILFGYLWQHGYGHPFILSMIVWVIFPFIQYACILLLENSIDIYKSLKPLYLSLSNPNSFNELRDMREKLSDSITQFVNENGSSALEDFDVERYAKMSKKEKRESGRFMTKDKSLVDSLHHLLDDKHLFNLNSSESSEQEES